MNPLSRPLADLPRGEAIQELRRRVARRLMSALFGSSRAAALRATTLPLSGIHRILVCHVSHTLGNTLLLTPLLREIQATYPGAEVDVVTRSPVADDIFGAFFCVRRIHRLPRHGLASPRRMLAVLRALRATHYDLAIDPCLRSQSDRIGVMWVHATHKLGFAAAGKSGALDHAVAAPTDLRHVGQLPVHLLRTAIGDRSQRPMPPLDIGLTDAERAAGSLALARVAGAREACIGTIGLFANATGSKLLPPAWWHAFAEHLAALHPEFRIVEIVPASGNSVFDGRHPAFYSSEIRKLAQAISALSLFISADCGVMHLACACGTPTAGLFCASDAGAWGPYGADDAIIEIGTRGATDIADAMPVTRLARMVSNETT